MDFVLVVLIIIPWLADQSGQLSMNRAIGLAFREQNREAPTYLLDHRHSVETVRDRSREGFETKCYPGHKAQQPKQWMVRIFFKKCFHCDLSGSLRVSASPHFRARLFSTCQPPPRER